MTNKNKRLEWVNNQWIEKGKRPKFIIEERILDYNTPIRGIYGIFIVTEEVKYCAYVGRSTSIYRRLFGSNGHIAKMKTKKGHPISNINRAMKSNDKTIYIKILQEVALEGDNFYKDMQRLASAECQFIDYYQDLNQCLEQIPEGIRMTEKEWRKNIKNL